MSGAAETHLILVWETARPALDRILEDARGASSIRDVVEVTWRRERFRRSLSRLYGTDLPPDSDKERESGTGPFVVVVVDDLQPRTVARKTQRGWTPANAALLAAKRRYRGWSGGSGSYRVHTTLTHAKRPRMPSSSWVSRPRRCADARGTGSSRQRRREPLGDPDWTSLDELETALAATMRCAFPATEHPDAPFEVVTDDAWWASESSTPRSPKADRSPTNGCADRSSRAPSNPSTFVT